MMWSAVSWHCPTRRCSVAASRKAAAVTADGAMPARPERCRRYGAPSRARRSSAADVRARTAHLPADAPRRTAPGPAPALRSARRFVCDCKFTLYLQITLFTVHRRKKKCIRYLQGEGRCASPVSSDGSAIDSPPSPLDALQCVSSAFPSDKLAAPADSTHREHTDPLPVSAPLTAAVCSSRPNAGCSPAPAEPSACSVASTGT